MVFASRSVAGRCLAERVVNLPRWQTARTPRAVVTVPSGGVRVADEVARSLSVPLDVVLVRRITAPGNLESTIGAIAEDSVAVYAPASHLRFAADAPHLPELARETEEWLTRRAGLLRGGHPPVDVAGGDVVLVDDGMVTGATVRGAAAVLRHRGAAGVVLAVPVAPPGVLRRLRPLLDEIVCLEVRDVRTVDAWYRDRRPTTDTEIAELLASSHTASTGRHTAHGPQDGCRESRHRDNRDERDLRYRRPA